MRPQTNSRRSYGTGSIRARGDSWYGQWWIGERRVQRKLSPKRQPGSRDGLTRSQAERELRRMIETEQPTPTRSDVTLADAGQRLVAHLEAMGRKPSTLANYRSLLTTHLEPVLGDRPLDKIEPERIEQMVARMRRDGAGPKVIHNALTLLRQVFGFGQRKGWCRLNPAQAVDRPKVEQTTDIRFLEVEEVEALLAAVPEDSPLGHTDRAMYLTAAMAGLRQGELLALRWRDVDWQAGRIRIRQNYVRGHWGTPKSRRGSRSVPMIDRVAGELERHFQRSAFQVDDDLVFPHPVTGDVLGHSALARRYKKALRRAKVRNVRFQDLRHTFGTRMAAAGVPMRTLQEWMGHASINTTLVYADYSPSEHENAMAERAFGSNLGSNLSRTDSNSDQLTVPESAEGERTEPAV
jgi:integrase